MSMKNPLTPPGIEPATFRFVAQHLIHCATAVPVPKGKQANFIFLEKAEKYSEKSDVSIIRQQTLLMVNILTKNIYDHRPTPCCYLRRCVTSLKVAGSIPGDVGIFH